MRKFLLISIIIIFSCKKDTRTPPVTYTVKYEVISSDTTSLIIVRFTKPDGNDSTANNGIQPPLISVPWSYQNSFIIDNMASPPKGKLGFTVLDNQAGFITERIYVNGLMVAQAIGNSSDNLIGVRLTYDLK